MPQDPKKQQKTVMKKRKKSANQHRLSSKIDLSFSKNVAIQEARTYPLFECLISSSWKDDNPGLVQIIIARQNPDTSAIYSGVYLVDKLCLGLKNTMVNAGYSVERYRRDVVDRISARMLMQKCDLELAQQMIYASIEYAAQFGFLPQRDFNQSQYLLTPRGELPEPYKISFGRDGQPLYISGPNDNPQQIIKQLELTAGEGNFNYIMRA
jgi:hypothetical protein